MVFSFFKYALKKLSDVLNNKKDDPLHLTRLVTTGLSNAIILKFWLMASFIFNIFLFLVEIIYFSVEFDLKQFIQFFSLNVGALHSYASMWIGIAYEYEALKTIDYQDRFFIKLSTVKESTYERIIECVTIRRYLFLLNFCSAHLLYLFFWPLFGYEDEYYFAIFFFNEYLKPLFGQYVVYALRLSFYLSFYPAIGTTLIPVQMMLYSLSHMEFQMIILEDNIQGIDDSSMNDRLVNENLVVCIKHYLYVKKCMDILRNWTFCPMLLTVVGSFVLLLSYSYFIIAQASLEALPRVVLLGMVCGCSAAIYAICGQGLVDQCEEVNKALYCLRWYGYSKKNCCLLRMFMVTTYKPLYLNLIGYIALDATLVMKVYKFVYSSLATIQQIVALRHKEE